MIAGPDFSEREQAAVDACEGIPTELLQSGFLQDLMSAVRTCFETNGIPDTEVCQRVALRLRQLDAIQEL